MHGNSRLVVLHHTHVSPTSGVFGNYPNRGRCLTHLLSNGSLKIPIILTTLKSHFRIKGNMTGGGLVVGVEATPAPAGEFLSPLQLRLRTRGSADSPDTVYL